MSEEFHARVVQFPDRRTPPPPKQHTRPALRRLVRWEAELRARCAIGDRVGVADAATSVADSRIALLLASGVQPSEIDPASGRLLRKTAPQTY